MNAPLSNRDTLLSQWKEASAELAKWKAQEAMLRTQVIEATSERANEATPEGTENIDLGWGHKLKIVHKLNYKLDNADDAARTKQALDAIQQSEEAGYLIAERLVKWKPELSVSEYKRLSPAQRAMIDKALTITPGTASVELVPPKGA